MRFVAVKTIEQQDIQAIHRMRSLAVDRRTAQINQIRGLLLEYGIEIAKGRPAIQRRLPEILENADNGLSERFRAELHGLAEELRYLNERVAGVWQSSERKLTLSAFVVSQEPGSGIDFRDFDC